MTSEIYLCGSCAMNDIIRTMISPKNYNEFYGSPNKFLGKLSADAIPPGPIADRLYNDMSPHIYGNNGWPKLLSGEIKLQFADVIEHNRFDTILNKAKNNVLCVDLSNEFLPSVITKDEQFLLKTGWPAFSQYFPEWFQKIVRDNTYHYDSYDKTMIMDRHHSLSQSLDLIKGLPAVTIGIGNMYTNKIYDNITKQVVEHISLFNEKIPFLKKMNEDNEYLNFEYFKKQIDGFYRVFKSHQITSGFYWLDLEEYCYADTNHPIRQHPLHLHNTSKELAAFKLQDIINEALLSTCTVKKEL